MTVNDCIHQENANAVRFEIGQALTKFYHDKLECDICQGRTEKEHGLKFIDGDTQYYYGIAGDFPIDKKHEQMLKEGMPWQTDVSVHIFIENNAVISTAGIQHYKNIRFEWEYDDNLDKQDSDYPYTYKIYDPQMSSDNSFTTYTWDSLSNATNNIDENSLYNSFNIYSYSYGGDNYRGDGGCNVQDYTFIFSDKDRVNPGAFGELVDISDRRVMTYYYSDRTEKYRYNCYLYGFKESNSYVVALTSDYQNVEELHDNGYMSESDYAKHRDVQEWLSSNFEYDIIRGFNSSNSDDIGTQYCSFTMPYEPDMIKLHAEPITDKSYINVESKGSYGQFFLDPESDCIILSNINEYTKNCKFVISSINGDFKFKINDIAFAHGGNLASSAKSEAQYVYQSKYIDQKLSGLECGFDFDTSRVVQQYDQFSDDIQSVDTSSLVTGSFPKNTSFSTIASQIKKLEIDTGRPDLKCVGFIGISEPKTYVDETKQSYWGVGSYILGSINNLFSYGIGGVTDKKLYFNNIEMMTNGGYVFIPNNEGMKLSNKKFNYSKTINGMWTTFYPVFAPRRNTLLLNVYGLNVYGNDRKTRDLHMASVVICSLAKSYAKKMQDEITDEKAAEDAQEFQHQINAASNLFDKAVIASSFINDVVKSKYNYKIDIEDCFSYEDLSKQLSKAELYDSTVVNMMAPCWRDHTGHSGKCLSTLREKIGENKKIGFNLYYTNFWYKLKTNLTYICASDFAAGAFQSPIFAPNALVISDKGKSKYIKAFIGADAGASRSLYIGDENNSTDRYLLAYILENAFEHDISYSDLDDITRITKQLKIKVMRAASRGLAQIISNAISFPKFLICKDGRIRTDNSMATLVYGTFAELNSATAETVDYIGNWGQRYLLNDDAIPKWLFMFIYACTAPELFSFYLGKVGTELFYKYDFKNYDLTQLTMYDGKTLFEVSKEFVNTQLQSFSQYDKAEKYNQYFYSFLFPVFLNYHKETFDRLSEILKKSESEMTSDDEAYIKDKIRLNDIIELGEDKVNYVFTKEYLDVVSSFEEYANKLDQIVQGVTRYIDDIWACRTYVSQVLGNLGEIDDYDMWSILFTNLVSDFPHAKVIKGDSNLREKPAFT